MPIFKMDDTDFKKNGSVLLYLNIPRADTYILCLVGVLHLLNTKRQHKTFMSWLLTSRQKNNCLKFLANRKIIKLLLQCIELLRNLFCTCFVGKNYLTQQGNANEKLFPWLTEISVICRQVLWSVQVFFDFLEKRISNKCCL